MNTHLSLSIFLSSIQDAAPKSDLDKSFKFVIILAPVALESLEISLSLILLIAKTPDFAR